MLGDLERSRRLYQILLLPDFSGIEDVRQAYKTLALKYHPDKNLHDPSAAEKFRDVRVAYEILSSVERKRKYDCTLRLFQPLGPNSFTPGAPRTPRATGPGEGGNATSRIYEELNAYAARRAERERRRAASASASTPRGDRASQYTKEQREFFRKREKEHRAELRRRREQERREQREREMKALRREQENKERLQQQCAESAARRAHSSTGVRRTSPIPAPAPEYQVRRENHKSPAKPNSSREFHPSSTLPDTVRPIPSPRPRRASFDPDGDRVERLRREKERQAEVRKAEQEKYLERLMKQRIREVRLREREVEEAEKQERENQRQLLFMNEKSEREQVIIPQEQLERRRLWREYEQGIRRCLLVLRLRQALEMENSRRLNIGKEAKIQQNFLYLQTREAWGRAFCVANENSAWETLISWYIQRLKVICIQEQKSFIRKQCTIYDNLNFSEAIEFNLIKLQKQENANRLCMFKEYIELLHIHRGSFKEIEKQILVKNALIDQRGIIDYEEHLERISLQIIIHEWINRYILYQEEQENILKLIKKRASDRYARQLAAEERARLTERRANASTIAALQVEIQRLKRALHAASIPIPQEKNNYQQTPVSPLRLEPFLKDGLPLTPRSGTEIVRNSAVNKGGTPRPVRPIVTNVKGKLVETNNNNNNINDKIRGPSGPRRATPLDTIPHTNSSPLCDRGSNNLAETAPSLVLPIFDFTSYLQQKRDCASSRRPQSTQRSYTRSETR